MLKQNRNKKKAYSFSTGHEKFAEKDQLEYVLDHFQIQVKGSQGCRVQLE